MKWLRELFEAIWKGLNPPERKRLELKFVPYEDAEKLIHEGWTIAKEEDKNPRYDMVYLEKLEEYPTFK